MIRTVRHLEAVTDGLALDCFDCGQKPRFGFKVTDEFWEKHVKDGARLSVLCLSCLDRRCGGEGLAEALEEVQFVATGCTVLLVPVLAVQHQ